MGGTEESITNVAKFAFFNLYSKWYCNEKLLTNQLNVHRKKIVEVNLESLGIKNIKIDT